MSDAPDEENENRSLPIIIWHDMPRVFVGEACGAGALGGARLILMDVDSFLAGFDDPRLAIAVGRKLIRAGRELLGDGYDPSEESGGWDDSYCDPDDPTDIEDGD